MRHVSPTSKLRACALAALVVVALGGCTGLHDWGIEPAVDGGTDGGIDMGSRDLGQDAGCTDCGGECVDLQSDVTHCGFCDVDCTLLDNVAPDPVGVMCSMGVCVIPAAACLTGFADCGGSTNGCETDITLPRSCGSCTNSCTGTATPLCDAAAGMCTDVCASGGTLCGATCIDTTSDARNCGICGQSCAAIAGSTATCVDSVCGYECVSGRHDCGTVCGDDTSPNTCGTSCTPCPPGANAAATCVTGMCGTACLPGFHDCGGVCVDDDDTGNCGTSCTACPAPPGATATCDGVACGVACQAGEHLCGDACLSNTDMGSCGTSCVACPTPPNARALCDGAACSTACRDTHADCNGTGDGSDADGCEADLSDPLHCGSCASVCSGALPFCRMGATTFGCVAGCAGTESVCGTTCANLQTSVQDCGMCGVVCPAPANGDAACSAGVCGVVCDASYHACGGACVANASPNSCGSSCTACASPVNATATCNGVACGWECNPGYHMCGGACVDDCSLATCGTACSPCPTPTNGTATCDGSACGFVCNTGYHRCGSACVANASPATCGTSCSACPAPTNGTATCDGTDCDFTCNATYHRCGGGCASNTATASCGAACSPCVPPPNADATCDGTDCGFTCRAGFHLCGGACVSNTAVTSCGPTSCTSCSAPANAVATCSGTACGFECSPGFANCDGSPGNGCEANLGAAATCGTCTRVCSGATPICADGACTNVCTAPTPTLCAAACVNTASDPAHCGGCGMGCTAPTSGNPTCTASVCGFACDPGFHACGATCASNDSPLSCGASCTPCGAPTNATATCAGGTCGFVCNSGFNRCGGVCVPEDSITACGTSCTTCTAPPSGSPVCAGGACSFTCVSGTHRCGASCANNNSTASCGTSCVPCVPPANGSSTCDGTACGFTCNAGYLPAGAACVAIAPPRPLYPLSMSSVTSMSPVLRWVLAPGTDGARIEVCADRACTMIARTIDVSGSTGTVTPALAPGLWFWRLTGRSGPSTGVLTSPVWEMTLTHRSASGSRSTAWGATIDHNGDGFADVLVGAPRIAAVYSHRGGAAGLSSTASGTYTGPTSFGEAVSAAGDVDGDGFSDVIVGAPGAMSAYVYYGSPTGLGARTPRTLSVGVASHGEAVAAAGDVNGDGYGDVLVGAPDVGRVYVYRGSATGPITPAAWVIDRGDVDFGSALASAGDVNADGFADIIVGDPGSGEARIYHGAAAGLGLSSVRTLSGTMDFGAAVAGAGDVNGDGYTDVVVGAPAAKRAYVYRGSATGISTTATTLSPSGSDAFGVVATSAGDVDGDGYDDVMVGSPGPRHGWIFAGGSGGIDGSAMVTFSPPMGPTGAYGSSVASPGDVNGDDLADVLIGAPGATTVYLYVGRSGSAPSTTATVVLVGPAGSAYGETLALLFLDPRRRMRRA